MILKDGRFQLTTALKMYRLEDRLEFLYRLFAGSALDKSVVWWSHLKAGLNLRNALTHPRTPRSISEQEVIDSLHSIIEVINILFEAVYGKPYPARGRQLDSKLNF